LARQNKEYSIWIDCGYSTVPFRIQIACPASPGSKSGNRVTALRWARILRESGCRVRVSAACAFDRADLLIALHARRSARIVRAFRRQRGNRPLVLALTGTDLYRDLPGSASARGSVALADRLVVLHGLAARRLPRSVRSRVRVIHQSVRPMAKTPVRRGATFDVCVIGHLRSVKDPFRAALAVRGLGADSAIRVLHIGEALDARFAQRARAEQCRNARYRWLGVRSRPETLRRLARSRLMVISSRMEGGANVIGEAATLGVPILASRIDGNVGLLGADHPGLFTPGGTDELRALLVRAESDAAFISSLRRASRRIAPLFKPQRERRAWRSLLSELRQESVRVTD